MRFTLAYSLDATDEAEAMQLHELGRTALSQHATVIGSACNPDEHDFTVIGSIKGQPDQAWSEVIKAVDGNAARAQALAADSSRTVVAVLAGNVQVSM